MQSENDGRGEDTHPAYSGVMLRCGDKVLLCKRRDDIGDEYLPGYWSVPAGYVEEDEEIKTCAIRETFEETKIELDPSSVKFLSAYPAHGGRGVFYDYVCMVDSEFEPVLDEEHSDWGYFGVSEIPTPITDEMRSDVILALEL